MHSARATLGRHSRTEESHHVAAVTAAVREWTPSFVKVCSRCVRTVAGETQSFRAICELVSP